ncbi:MAG: HEAT repeat domain-containing protein [Acidobacteriota bacterium]
MPITRYCPACWEEIGDVAVCPSCGVDIRHLAADSYEEKLIRALHHPEPTVPVRAATILGELMSGAAVPALIKAASSTEDPYLQEAVALALGAIGDKRALPCLDRLRREGALRVRAAAGRALGRINAWTDRDHDK